MRRLYLVVSLLATAALAGLASAQDGSGADGDTVAQMQIAAEQTGTASWGYVG
jgi:hypothetical protein